MTATPPPPGPGITLLDHESEIRALTLGFEALLRTLSPEQKGQFQRNLQTMMPSPTAPKFAAVVAKLIAASR